MIPALPVLLAAIPVGLYFLLRTPTEAEGVTRRETIGGAIVAVKRGVQWGPGLDPRMSAAIDAARTAGLAPVVTSALRPGDRGSLHAVGRALDFRTRHLDSPEALEQMAETMRGLLGPRWNVVLEAAPQPHAHVELDPPR